MRVSVTISLLLVFGWTLKAPAQQTKEITSYIDAVTVFSDRAEITRKTSDNFLAGEYRVKITGLPAGLVDESVRVSGSGTAGAQISGVKIETVYLDTIPQVKLSKLKTELKTLQEQVAQYDDRYSVLSKETKLLDQIKDLVTSGNVYGGKEKAQALPGIGDWVEFFSFYDSKSNALNLEMRQIEKSRNELQTKMNKLGQDISALSGYGKLSLKNASVDLTITKGGTLRLEMIYSIFGAYWYPIYDVRVDQEDKGVELVYYGMVAQKTGEDWKNALLTLSTARPSISATLPELSGWYLNEYIPYSYKPSKKSKSRSGSGGGAAMKMESAGDYGDGGFFDDEEEMVAEIDVSSVETHGVASVFKISKRTDIPADGSARKTTVTVEKLTAEFEYVAIPKIKENAYLLGKVENTTDFPFLEGDLNVFFGNNFIGTSYLHTVVPEEKFDVFLGIDDGMRVKREQIKDFQGESGLFSKSVKKTFEYKIKIENLKGTQERLTLKDQVPVSQSDKIEISLINPDLEKEEKPAGFVRKNTNGVLEWRFDLKPKEKREVIFKYRVTYPADIQVEGLY